ncbi:hypothetical protein WP50_20880, partial [Lactiplantibacillus plantarum]
MDAERRVDQLVTAFDQVHHKITDATLVIYGYGGELDRLKQQVSQLHLETAVTFAGYQPNFVSKQQAQHAPISISERHAHEIIYTGRLDAERRVDQLVTAFDQVHHKITDATLVIYGYGGELDPHTHQVAQVNIETAVTCAGYEPNFVSKQQAQHAPISISERHAHEIIYTGRLDAERRVDQLVTALDHVHHKIRDKTLAIYGYGGEHNGIQQQV